MSLPPPHRTFPLRLGQVLCLTFALSAAGSASVHAQDRGYWRASSKTAKSITGDLSLSELKVAINFSAFTVAQIRAIQATEANALFSDLEGTAATGNLYRLVIPGNQRFLHKQTLCGTEDTQWMITAVEGKNLRVAFFSGPGIPVLTAESMANATTLCGTFTYVR